MNREQEIDQKSRELQIPDKLSDFLEAALDDLERCSQDPRYRINMGQWHTPRDGRCEICLAGAYLTRVLDPQEPPKFRTMEMGLSLSLETLNAIRGGYWEDAIKHWNERLRCAGKSPQLELEYSSIPSDDQLPLTGLPRTPFPESPEELADFVKDLRKAVEILRGNEW